MPNAAKLYHVSQKRSVTAPHPGQFNSFSPFRGEANRGTPEINTMLEFYLCSSAYKAELLCGHRERKGLVSGEAQVCLSVARTTVQRHRVLLAGRVGWEYPYWK